MPSTVYKGDLTEISFGHETAMKLTHDYAGTFLFYQSARDVSAGTSTIKFGGGAASTPCNGGILSYPLGMLVGCRLTFSAASNGFVLDDNTTTGRVYTIIAHELDTVTKLTITPALVNTVTGSGGDDDSRSDAGSSIIIHSYKLPSADVNMAVAAGANASNESVLTDQFLGIASTVTLPETKIDLKRYHVVGLGRDVAVQVPGRFTNEGGSFEVNMHNPRWLYYALGMEAIDINSVGAGGGQFDTLVDVESTGVLSTGVVSAASNTAINVDTVDATTKFNIGESLYDDAGAFVGLITNVVSGTITLAANNITEIGNNENLKRVAQRLNGATEVGESRITYDGGAPDFLGGTDPVAVGDYVILKDISTTDIVTYKASDSGNTFGVVSNPEHNYFDKTETSEIRRIVGITATDIWLDDGLSFPHADNLPLRFARFNTGSTQGSPDRAAATGTLTNGVTRLLYSRSTVPSFAMEVSIRRNDTADSGTATTEVTDGSSTDAKTLTRVFRGCKVKDFSITADTDAALRMNVNFDAALCYTDTGRLEGAKATATLTALSKTGGQANTRVLTLSDGSNSVNFSIDNSTSTSTASVIGFSNANSNANQFATNIAAAVNAADTAGTLNMSAVASDATVTLTQNNNGVAGNTTPSGTAISDSVITLASAFSGGQSTGDRYNTHRMFEDTASTGKGRKESGIAVGTQKPFMFYNGIITLAGVTLGQVTSFTLSGNTGVTQYYAINGSPVVDAATDQVPFGGTRNASISVEGKTEYSMDMEIIVDDPVMYHKMRRSVGHDPVDTPAATTNQIRLSFTKAGTGATRETLDILLDDFFIIEAPLPIPEDKGVIKAPLKIMPKGIRVISTDTLLHC